MRRRVATYVFALSLLASSCVDPYANSGNRPRATSREGQKSTVTFEEVRTRLFEPHCTRCHSGYSSYDEVVSTIGQIRTAIEQNRMPKRSPPLANSERDLLVAWIEGGLKRASSDPPTPNPPTPPSLDPTWNSLSTLVFRPRCVVCHNPNGEARFLDLSSRRSIFERRNDPIGARKFIDIDDPRASGLLVILEDDDEPMPPTESGLDRPTSSEFETIREWIALGLP